MLFLRALVSYCAGQILFRIAGNFGGEASCVHTQPRTREGAVDASAALHREYKRSEERSRLASKSYNALEIAI